MKMGKCTICCKRFQSHSRKIMCCVCDNEFRIKCMTLSPEGVQQLEENYTKWFCKTCTTEIFPFNKQENDLDVLSVTKDMCLSSRHQFSYHSGKLFGPFELNDSDHVFGLSDVNPEHFFSSYNKVSAKYSYYLESSFNEDIAQNKCAKDAFYVSNTTKILFQSNRIEREGSEHIQYIQFCPWNSVRQDKTRCRSWNRNIWHKQV